MNARYHLTAAVFQFQYAAFLAIALMAGGCYRSATDQSNAELANAIESDRAWCQAGNDDSCASYVADQYISTHCRQGGLIPALMGMYGYVKPQCTEEVYRAVGLIVSCRKGDKAACVDVQTAVALEQERAAQAQAAIQMSALQAQWEQASALREQARQMRLLNLKQ